jgi:hypothetical protein
MSRASANSVMQAAAKVLAWELFAVAGYGRTRAYVNVEKFDCAMRSAARQWRQTQSNLKEKRRKDGRTE